MNTLVKYQGSWKQLQVWHVKSAGTWKTVESAHVKNGSTWRIVWPNLLPAPTLTHAYCQWESSKVVAKAQWNNIDSRAWGSRVELWQGGSKLTTTDYARAANGAQSWTGATSLSDNVSYTIKVYALSQANAYPSETPVTSSFVVPSPVTSMWANPWYGNAHVGWTDSVTSSANKVWLSCTNGYAALLNRGSGGGVDVGAISEQVTYYCTAYAENHNTLGQRSQGRPVTSSYIWRRPSPAYFGPDAVLSQRNTGWRSGSTSYQSGFYYQGYQSGYGTNQGWAWYGNRFYDTLGGATVHQTDFKGWRDTSQGGQGNSSAGTIWHYVHNYRNQGETPLNQPPNGIAGGEASCGKPGNDSWVHQSLGSYGGTYGNELANRTFGRVGWGIYDKQGSENNRAVFSSIEYNLHHSG